MELLGLIAAGAVAGLVAVGLFGFFRGKQLKKAKAVEATASTVYKGENPIKEEIKMSPKEATEVEHYKSIIGNIENAPIDSQEYIDAENAHLDRLNEYATDADIANVFRASGYDELDLDTMVQYARRPDLRERTPSKTVGRGINRRRLRPLNFKRRFDYKCTKDSFREWLESPEAKYWDNHHFEDVYEKERRAYNQKKSSDGKNLWTKSGWPNSMDGEQGFDPIRA